MTEDPSRSTAPIVVRVAGDDNDEEEETETMPDDGRVSSSPPVLGGGGRGSRYNLQVPFEQYGGAGGNSRRSPGGSFSAETLFEEESDLIRSCGALSSVLGLRRSFSLFDITPAAVSECDAVRACASEMALCGGGHGGAAGAVANGRDDVLGHAGRLDYASRSCSTWVAVGDMASTSQLPSPQGPPGEQAPAITAADFVKSCTKKLRQTYIRRRLLTTYKALERVAPSELNLQAMGRRELAALGRVSQSQVSREILRLLRRELPDAAGGLSSGGGGAGGVGGQGGFPSSPAGLLGAARTLSLTTRDVERDKGKPLTKYERNMLIFNWLHSLDESSLDRMS